MVRFRAVRCKINVETEHVVSQEAWRNFPKAGSYCKLSSQHFCSLLASVVRWCNNSWLQRFFAKLSKWSGSRRRECWVLRVKCLLSFQSFANYSLQPQTAPNWNFNVPLSDPPSKEYFNFWSFSEDFNTYLSTGTTFLGAIITTVISLPSVAVKKTIRKKWRPCCKSCHLKGPRH